MDINSRPIDCQFDACYYKKTNRNFHEVITSYYIGNYRSAIVSLYSTVIVDTLLRLKELDEVYEEKCAKEILKTVFEKTKNITKNSKGESIGYYNSQWEGYLLNEANNSVHLFAQEVWLEIRHLAELRNQCAHPSVDTEFDLLSPLKSSVFAVLNEIYFGLLIKPPLLISRISDKLISSLKERNCLYCYNYYDGKLKLYLETIFFSKMTFPVHLKIVQTLWKLSFALDNDDCNQYRRIYVASLDILLSYIAFQRDRLINDINEHSDKYAVLIKSDDAMSHCIRLLAKHQYIYKMLPSSTVDIIDYATSFIDNQILSWFKFETCGEFIRCLNDSLDESCSGTLSKENVSLFYVFLSEYGLSEQALDIFIKIYSKSNSYDTANARCSLLISPYLDLFNSNQIERILIAIENNSQLYNSWSVTNINHRLINKASIKSIDCSPENYPNFYRTIEFNSE